MTFWLIVAALIVVGFALAWWTSGKAKPRPSVSGDDAQRRMQGRVAQYRADSPGNVGGAGGAGGVG